MGISGNGVQVSSAVARPRPQTRAHARRRVLILSADVGEGHDSAARTLAGELTASGAEVTVRDGLAALGRLLQRVIRDGSRIQFERYPWTFGPVYVLLMHVPPVRWVAERVLFWIGARGLLRLIHEHDPDIVVSTYPGLTSILGRLRRRGRLGVPACSAILDLTSFPFWTSRGVDHHFAMHEPSVPVLERMVGRGGVQHVRPVVDRAFLEPRERDDARRALDLPLERPVVVMVGGGWGIGDIEGAVPVALELGEVSVVAVAGRNEALRERLARAHCSDARVRVLGFTDSMSDLLAAADALVHPGGGVTALEALARVCATVIYAPPPGHWRANARAMRRLGLAEVARGPAELRGALSRAVAASRPAAMAASRGVGAAGERGAAPIEQVRGPDDRAAGERPRDAAPRRADSARNGAREIPTAAALIRSLAPRVQPTPRWQLAAGRAAATLVLTVVLAAGALSTDETYSVAAARFQKLRPVSELPVRDPLVGVIVQAPGSEVPALARRLARGGRHVTFTDRALEPSSVRAVRALDDEVVPELRSSEASRWLSTRKLLRREVRALALPRRFFYLAPRDGATLGQYALARSVGGSPVVGAHNVRVRGRSGTPAGDGAAAFAGAPVGTPLRPGDIVVVSVSSAADAPALVRYLDRIERERLSPAPLGRLASGGAPRTDRPG
jgi:processive 1,2-diacylglycerol beta-glucosyltransferase